MEYNIGDTVIIKQPEEIVDRSRGNCYAWTKRKGNTAGEIGTIADKMYSEAESIFLYRICIEGETRIRSAFYTEEDFEHYIVETKQDYSIDCEILENLAVVRIYKDDDGEKKEIGRGHGHIFHEGDIGVVQAISYACKKAYEKLNNGSL